MRGMKLGNDYATEARAIDAPKAVWMAIALSFALRLNEDNMAAAIRECKSEWWLLHSNGIVPQGPPTERHICTRCGAKYDHVLPGQCPLCMVAATDWKQPGPKCINCMEKNDRSDSPYCSRCSDG